MKTNRLFRLSVVLVVGIVLLTRCSGYIIATGPPMPQTEIIVQPPSVYHVWIPGYYEYRGGTFIWIQGHYQIPPKGKKYVPGQWQKTNRGYKRQRGHWQRG